MRIGSGFGLGYLGDDMGWMRVVYRFGVGRIGVRMGTISVRDG